MLIAPAARPEDSFCGILRRRVRSVQSEGSGWLEFVENPDAMERADKRLFSTDSACVQRKCPIGSGRELFSVFSFQFSVFSFRWSVFSDQFSPASAFPPSFASKLMGIPHGQLTVLAGSPCLPGAAACRSRLWEFFRPHPRRTLLRRSSVHA